MFFCILHQFVYFRLSKNRANPLPGFQLYEVFTLLFNWAYESSPQLHTKFELFLEHFAHLMDVGEEVKQCIENNNNNSEM